MLGFSRGPQPFTMNVYDKRELFIPLQDSLYSPTWLSYAGGAENSVAPSPESWIPPSSPSNAKGLSDSGRVTGLQFPAKAKVPGF